MKHNLFTRLLSLVLAMLMVLSVTDMAVRSVYAEELEEQEAQEQTAEEEIPEESAQTFALTETYAENSGIVMVRNAEGKVDAKELFEALKNKYNGNALSVYYFSQNAAASEKDLNTTNMLSAANLAVAEISMEAGTYYIYTKSVEFQGLKPVTTVNTVCTITVVNGEILKASSLTLREEQLVVVTYLPNGEVNMDTLVSDVLKAVVDADNCVPSGQELSAYNVVSSHQNEDYSFTVTVGYAGNEEYKSCTKDVKVWLSDNRQPVVITPADGVPTVQLPVAADKSINFDLLYKSLFKAMCAKAEPAVLTEENVTFTYLNNGKYGSLEGGLLGINKITAGTHSVKMEFAGNSEYQGASVTMDVNFVEVKLEIAYNEGVEISFNPDASKMKGELFQKVINWDKTTLPEDITAEDMDFEYKHLLEWLPVEGSTDALGISHPRMGGGEQTVRVRLGSKVSGLISGLTGDGVKITVKKAACSVKVNSASVSVAAPLPANLVVVSPDPSISTVTVFTGATTNLSLAVYLKMPESILTNSEILKTVDPIVQKVTGMSFAQMLQNGLSVGDLRKLVKAEDLMNALSKLGFDFGVVGEVLKIVDKLPGVADNVRISLGTPNRAGLYNVTAIAGDANYETAVGTGTLNLKIQTANVSIAWNSTIPGSIKASELGNYNFGAVIKYNGQPAPIQDGLKITYTGLTKKFRLYVSSKTPTEPGSYVETAATIGGSYNGKPITRAFRIVNG